ncbi:hypothetical protein M8332_04985 [Fructilactobacillus ixorae]|uniref:Uncharacterized protein n=1 Tax=Fructilactobacillus ixorae TaxID=1750535 RepID=A0ABY5C2I0_9LACO|nr:hypothetical protein [Fructilactobacillus ixorae]USS92964.1 hypothetical protein M8332_04985 [Fructilactobacillus ixorae]
MGQIIIGYLYYIYAEYKEMEHLIDRYADEDDFICFDKKTNRQIISSMNYFQAFYMGDGDVLYDYIDGDLLQTETLNMKINWFYLAGITSNGKKNVWISRKIC